MKKNLLISFLSLLIGVLIYLAFRSTDIILFEFLNYFGLKNLIYDFRHFTYDFKFILPNWFLYSLPDGLWLFSYQCIVLTIWKFSINNSSLIWLLILPVLFILVEFLQLYDVLKGTFDWFDILFFIFGSLLPIIINKKYINETKL